MTSASDSNGFLPSMKRYVLIRMTVGEIVLAIMAGIGSILASFFLGYLVFRFETSAMAKPPLQPVTVKEVCTRNN